MATSLYGSLGAPTTDELMNQTGLGYVTTPYGPQGWEQLGTWGNNMFGDQALTDEQKLAYLQSTGIPYRVDPQYGVLVNTTDPSFSQKYPVQNSSDIFDYGPLAMGGFLGAIGPLAGGALAGSGADLGGVTSATGSYTAPTAVAGASSTAPDYASLFGPSAGVTGADVGSFGSIPVDTGMAGATSLTGATAPFSQSVADAFGTDSTLSGGAGGIASTVTNQAAQSALSRILNGTATTDDYLKAAGSLGSAALGAYGANQSANAYKDVASQYLGLGAPYRALLGQSYAPGFSMSNEPGYNDAIDQSTNSFLRAASAGRAPGVSGGNPMENPGAWGETLKYVTGNTALPALQNYRAGLAGAGQLGVSQSGPAALGGAQASGGLYDALGYGLNSLVNPQTDLQTLLKQLGGGGNNIFQTR